METTSLILETKAFLQLTIYLVEDGAALFGRIRKDTSGCLEAVHIPKFIVTCGSLIRRIINGRGSVEAKTPIKNPHLRAKEFPIKKVIRAHASQLPVGWMEAEISGCS